MKKIVKLTKIKKNNHANYTKKAIRKRKSHKKNIFLKKRNFYQIDSPHNTNDYLINNASTPFFNYNDNDNDEEWICLVLKKQNQQMKKQLYLILNHAQMSKNSLKRLKNLLNKPKSFRQIKK